MTRTARIPPGGGCGSAARGAAGPGAERGSVTVFVVFFTLVAIAPASQLDAAMTAPCAYPSPRQVTVYVSVTTTPLISTFFGSFTMKAHETACAEFGITRGVGC